MPSISSSTISSRVDIYNGELAYRDTIVSGGGMYVSSGGMANETTNSAGNMYVSSGGTADNTLLKGSKFWDYSEAGYMYVCEGGIANFTTLNSGGVLELEGGTVNHTTINSKGGLHVYWGTANSATVNSSGRLRVEDGTVSAVTVNSGGRLSVWYDGSAYDVTISSGGAFGFFSWKNTQHFDKIENGSATVSDNVTITGSALYVSSGGTADYTTVDIGHDYDDAGIQVLSGGTANYTTVNSNGAMYVSNSGIVNNTIVNSSGRLYIMGGSANNTTISHGRMYVESGGVANNIVLFGSQLSGSNYAGRILVKDGGSASNITISGGSMSVGEYGIVDSVRIVSGVVNVSWSGGTANSVFVDKDGELYVYNGGSATVLYNPWGNGTISDSYYGEYYEDRGHITYLDRDASVYYDKGGGIDGIIKGDTLSGINIASSQRAIVLDGGTIRNTRVTSGGLLEVTSEGVAEDVTVYHGGSVIVSGGTVSRALEAGADARIHVSSGALIKDNTVQDMALMELHGSADSTTVKDMGQVWIYEDGTATSAVVGDWGAVYLLSGGSVNDISVESCGKVHIGSGGTATVIRENGGCVEIEEGANVTFLANTFSGALLTSGEATLHSGTVALGATVKNAKMTVFDGGVAQETVVDGGSLTISSGGKITGPLSISNAAIVSACNGSIVDFDISSVEGGTPALINDLSQIDGTPDYTITVASDQADGTYRLAENASAFNSSISVRTDEETELGVLSVNGSFDSGDFRYSLASSNGVLSLKKAVIDIFPPEPPTASADITSPTNQNVTVTAVFSEDSATKQYSFNSDDWEIYTQPVTMSDNGTVYFRGIDEAGNISETTAYTVTNIDKIPPEAPTASADITLPTNHDVLVTAVFSEDSIQKQYSINGNLWSNYTQPIVMNDNGILSFRSFDEAGNVSAVTSYSVTNIDKGIPDTPENLTVKVNKYNATLSWNKVAAPKGMKVSYEVRVDEGEPYTTNSNKYTLKNASIGEHHFEVRTVFSNGKASGWSDPVSEKIKDITPPKPGSLSLVQTGADSVRLTWTPATDNSGKIEKYLITCGNENPVEVDGDTYSYEFSGVSGKLDATLTAYDAAENASKTVKKSITLKDVTSPDQVTGLYADEVNNKTGGVLTWNPATDTGSGVAQYLVIVDGKTYKTKTNSLTLKKIAAGDYHTFSVIAVDKAKNQSKESNICAFEVEDVIDPKIKKLSAKVNKDNTATFSWNAADETKFGGVKLTLDDEDIWETSAASGSYTLPQQLSAGKHILKMTAYDANDNDVAKSLSFNVKAPKNTGILAAV